MADVQSLLTQLQGVRKAGDGWIARCPGHDDQRQSLSVGTGEDGRVLLKCHAGCGVWQVLGSLGLASDALFTDEAKPTRREVAHYGYRDESGALLYEVVRFDPKDFRQRRPDGMGGWVWNLRETRRVLYRLPELRGHARVVIVEGEKDADRLWSMGIPATTNVGGAGKWREDYTQQLVDAGVQSLVILPDNDDPGRAHAAQVSAAWSPRAARVVVLPDIGPKGDVSDFLARRSAGDLVALLDEPKPVRRWLDVDAQWDAIETEDEEAAVGRKVWLGLQRVDETLNGIRRGEVLGLLARPAVGKTLVSAHVAHTVAESGVGHVFFSLEMPAAQIVARLQQRVFGLNRYERERAMRAKRLNREQYRATFQSLVIDETPGLSVAQMAERLAEIQSGPLKGQTLGLVTIDHLGLVGGDRKLTTYDRVSLQAREIKELAKRFQCAVLLVVQVNRDSGGDGSRELGLGSARDSGVVEEAMDYMVGLRRLDRRTDAPVHERERFKDVIFAKVIKNRHGDVDTRETAYRYLPTDLWLRQDADMEVTAENDIAQFANPRGGRRW